MQTRLLTSLLVLVILVPSLFYTVYEITTLNDTEAIISEIYQREMETLLFAVNQHCWSVVAGWAEDIVQHQRLSKSLMQQTPWRPPSPNISQIFRFIPGDTTITWAARDYRGTVPDEPFPDILVPPEEVLDQMLGQMTRGYRRIEVLSRKPEKEQSDYLALSFVLDLDPPTLGGMLIHSNSFFQDILDPKLRELARGTLVLSVRDKTTAEILFNTDTTELKDFVARKDLWMFPDLELGLGIRGGSLKQLVRQRLNRSLGFMLLIDVLLCGAVFYAARLVRKEVELARLKADFVSNVSHELRTPLSLIRLYAETLELGHVTSPEEIRESYVIIRTEAERLTHLINNVLDFSRMEAGKREYHFQRVDLCRITKETLDLFQYQLKDQGFEVETDCADGDAFIHADWEAIVEALMNLIDNSMKFSNASKFLGVRLKREKEWIEISVSDKGMGMDPDDQRYIFEKFYRNASARKRQIKGSGLGLAIVKHIMDAHDGRIKVESIPGQGTTITLIFKRDSKEGEE